VPSGFVGGLVVVRHRSSRAQEKFRGFFEEAFGGAEEFARVLATVEAGGESGFVFGGGATS
jgi:hypothetical protein